MSKVNIRKMRAELDSPIRYYLESMDGPVFMNDLIGMEITLRFTGEIHCVVCGKAIKKTFAQGSCYDCFVNAAENSECIIRPELCRAHLGEGRDPEWEKTHHDRPHFVYLALSSAVKVGVTRDDQIPTRWIDQGASEGLILAECSNRFQAGEMEVFLKDYFTDRTNWQRMLKNQISSENLAETKEKLIPGLPDHMASCATGHRKATVLEYPVLEYPAKVKSNKLDKVKHLRGRLSGIKGQYLLFSGGGVINLRAHSGYTIFLEY